MTSSLQPAGRFRVEPLVRHLRRALVVLCCLGGAIVAGQPRSVRVAPAPAGPLLVAASSDHYPYSFVDEERRFRGFAVDVLDAVARVMDLDVRRSISPLADVSSAFTAEGVAIQQLLTHSPEQLRYADLSTPYLTLQGAVFVRSGERRFATAADLRGQRARIATGGGGAAFARQQGIDAQNITIASADECLRLLAAGEVDAVILSRLTGLASAGRQKLGNIEPLAGIADDFVLRFCFGVRPGDARLLDKLNEGLAILFQTGEYERIYRKWFGRLEPHGFTREEVVIYVAAALALALAVALWALVRQRQLRRRIAGQTAQLAASGEFLAEAQKLAHVGHWQGSILDEGGVVWSDELFRIFERDPAAGPPRSLEELLGYVRADQREKWHEALRRLRITGEAYNLDLEMEPARGGMKTVHVRGRRVERPGGPPAVFGTVQDVTARRAADLALRQSSELVHALYQNLPHALGVVEQHEDDWSVVSLNPEALRLLSRSGGVALPCPLGELGLSAELEQQWRARFAAGVRAHGPTKTEFTSADRRRTYVTTLVPLGQPGAKTRCCFLVDDVTDERRNESELAQGRRLRALGELVGGIAHEFNNLLTPILLKADELQHTWAHEPELNADLKLITDTARRSAELTRRLLTFGRKAERRPEILELASVVRNSLDLLRQTIDRRIVFECRLPADLPRLYLCVADIQHILLNLLLNARDTLVQKLGRPPDAAWQPRVIIEAATQATALPESPGDAASPPTGWIALSVGDNGMGMAPDTVERIFEPFYTTKEVGHGTGLGLATVWHLVQELGGRITVDSGVREGTRFCVMLPVTPPPAEESTSSPPPALVPRPQREALSILVVEDETSIARLISALLEKSSHHADVVTNGAEASALLARDPRSYDGIVMDLNMPGLTGLELARRARALSFAGPILVISGRITDEDRAELGRLDVRAILPKPFTADLFFAAFQTHVAAAPRGASQLVELAPSQ